jgi:hypothetical protein
LRLAGYIPLRSQSVLGAVSLSLCILKRNEIFHYWGNLMRLRNLAAAACVLACTATASFAATFNVGGVDYDFSTVTGTFDDNRDVLTNNFWWGDQILASSLAATRDLNSIGFYSDFYRPMGAKFAYRLDFRQHPSRNIGVDLVSYASCKPYYDGDYCFDASFTISYPDTSLTVFEYGQTWMVATTLLPPPPLPSVPLPAGGLLLLSGLAGVAALKRRKKRSA